MTQFNFIVCQPVLWMIIFVCMHDITFHGIKPQFPREHAPASDHEQLPVQTGKRTNSSERIIFVWRLFAPNTTCEKPRNWFWFIFQERNGKRWRPVNGLPVSRRRRSCDWSTCRLDRCRVSQKKVMLSQVVPGKNANFFKTPCLSLCQPNQLL